MKFFFIIFATIFFVGCSSAINTPENTLVFSNLEELDSVEQEYQVSAPWDKEMYDLFYKRIKKVPDDIGRIYGGIVPHHLLAGYLDATFFDALKKQNPSTIVLFGPNHFDRGFSSTITTRRDWKTVYGIVQTEVGVLESLVNQGLVGIDEEVIKEEHSIYSLIPFVRKSLPQTKVLSFSLKNNISFKEMNTLAANLKKILPEDTIYVASIDFSHYQILPVANFHDEFSVGVIKSFDYDRLHKLEIDSVPSLYMVMKMMEIVGAQKVGFELSDNSAALTGALATRETTSYYSPYFTMGEPEMKRTVSMLHVGDIMLGRTVKAQIDKNGMDYIFENLDNKEGRFFKGYDIGIGNLEGPFANYRRDTSKEIAFRFDPVLISDLKQRNFELFTLANNHSLDMGSVGFEESKKNLDNAGTEYFGAQYGAGEESLLIKEVGGLIFGFVGLNDTNGPLDIEKSKKLIQDLETKVDHTIVNIHWGQEYKLLASNKRQQFLARALVDAGADVIVGHHPHVVQEMEIYKDRPIFYSLGNFIFDQYWSEPTQKGLAVGLVFHDTDAISSYLFFYESEQSQVNLAEYWDARNVLGQLIDASRLGEYTVDRQSFSITTKIK